MLEYYALFVGGFIIGVSVMGACARYLMRRDFERLAKRRGYHKT